jgi:hypothetical protein
MRIAAMGSTMALGDAGPAELLSADAGVDALLDCRLAWSN